MQRTRVGGGRLACLAWLGGDESNRVTEGCWICSARRRGGPDVMTPTKNVHGVLEERDPSYDEMLKHMVGRITTKPGGKPEMGEASVVQQYNRPLPKVRTSKAEPGQSGGRQLPSGALNVQHIQEIIQLYQGKSTNHQGPMSVDDIASRFRVEATIVQNIVQFVSLPQDETVKKKED